MGLHRKARPATTTKLAEQGPHARVYPCAEREIRRLIPSGNSGARDMAMSYFADIFIREWLAEHGEAEPDDALVRRWARTAALRAATDMGAATREMVEFTRLEDIMGGDAESALDPARIVPRKDDARRILQFLAQGDNLEKCGCPKKDADEWRAEIRALLYGDATHPADMRPATPEDLRRMGLYEAHTEGVYVTDAPIRGGQPRKRETAKRRRDRLAVQARRGAHITSWSQLIPIQLDKLVKLCYTGN